MSTDYYTRLEQGRRLSPSDSVLNSIARALRLDETGRQHLFDLCRRATPPETARAAQVQRVRWSTQQLMDSWVDQPAILLGRRTDVLATNALGRALLFDFDAVPAARRNYVRWMLLDPQARERMVDWPVVASEMVAVLRMEAGRFPDDRGISDLVGELAVKSEEFATWWADQRVFAHNHGTKRFRHPLVGEFELDWQALALPGDEDQTIFTYFAAPGSPAGQALRLLASWNATGDAAGSPADGARADESAAVPPPARAAE